MKALPMIFNTEMVQALMDGRKIQTRRPVKPEPTDSHVWGGWIMESTCRKSEGCAMWSIGNVPLIIDAVYARPPCRVNDLIYVRETFGIVSEEYGEYSPVYKADNWLRPKKWTPSIHMPRELSRITLKVTSVRVERVQDISEVDAVAEGCYLNEQYSDLAGTENLWPCPACNGNQVHGFIGESGGWSEVDCESCDTAKKRFSQVWQQIYGDHWDNNGWCWVIDFDVILKNVDTVISEAEV